MANALIRPDSVRGMRQSCRSAVAVPLGVAFGAATSLSNRIAVPFKSEDGSTVGDPIWAQAGEILSLILDSGWAWAALAVLAGWLTGARVPGSAVRGGVAGAVALLCATGAYYGMDAVLRSEPWYLGGIWFYASLIVGPVLGAIGSELGRPGVRGLLAGLTVPIGAATQMVVLPPGSALVGPQPAEIAARFVVWALAAIGVAIVVIHFLVQKRQLVTRWSGVGAVERTGSRAVQ